jgi:hypothetical protein
LENPRLFYDLLFTATAQTLLEIASDAKHLGAEIGVIAILLVATYAGKVSVAAAADPLKDAPLCTGYLILIYKEAADDTPLDGLDISTLSIDNDGLQCEGKPVHNTYMVMRYSFDALRGPNKDSSWYSTFAAADSTLDDLVTAQSDTERQKIDASAISLYQQGKKLLQTDPTHTIAEATTICQGTLASLIKKNNDSLGNKPSLNVPVKDLLPIGMASPDDTQSFGQLLQAKNDYQAKLADLE